MKKRGLVHIILALLMSMLLIVSTGCGKSGAEKVLYGKKTDKTEFTCECGCHSGRWGPSRTV